MITGSDRTELICSCDSCGSEEYGGTMEFRKFIEYLKGQNWKIKKEDDVWVHYCPDCRGDES